MGQKANNADSSITVELDEVVDGAASLNLEAVLPGAQVAFDDTRRRVLAITDPTGTGIYFAVAPPAAGAACRAQLNVTKASGAGQAKTVAKSLRRD